ncbi:ROK family protein [Shouchella sp. JSM 1781072]|uniref:ROK family protein n=1 Tax=Bacillaceae TaxID=186817 RepID=UPI000C089715|nr:MULTISPECIES: ROK family protein [Bacillaceae]UTR07424.1 ROK family protein [Alkalihalobacillus sp. LMS6]
MNNVRYGGLEAGGTKMICVVTDEAGVWLDRLTIPTLTPEETVPPIVAFFKKNGITSLGIGSFGPLDLKEGSDTYGSLASTPKKGWKGYPLLDAFNELNVPIEITTDVNGAALAEATKGAAKGLDSCMYITVGTGIGAGAVVNGNVLEGLSHPEMGHVPVKPHKDDSFQGHCPYHGTCAEGMAAGPAIEARWGKAGIELAGDDKVWQLEAYYLAQAIAAYTYVLSPKKVIIGGGVMKQKQLYALIREELVQQLNGYMDIGNPDDYVVPPGLHEHAGIEGALLLARQAERKR